MNVTSQPPRPRPNRRGGAVVICALVCMAIVTAMLGTLVKSTLLAKRQLRVETYLAQVEWCLDAAVARASRRLEQDQGYVGERWDVWPNPAHSWHLARIEIVVDHGDEDQDAVVSVLAEYPHGNLRSVRRRRSVEMKPVRRLTE